MDRIDAMLEEFFKPDAPPRLSKRLLGSLKTRPTAREAGRPIQDRRDRARGGAASSRTGRPRRLRAGPRARRARPAGAARIPGRPPHVLHRGRRPWRCGRLSVPRAGRSPAHSVRRSRFLFGPRAARGPPARRPRGRQRARSQPGAGDRPMPSHRARRRHLGPLRLRRRDEDPAPAPRAHDPGVDRLHEHADHLPARLRHEQRVGEANRVVFASVADAASVGYRPCRVCRPPVAA